MTTHLAETLCESVHPELQASLIHVDAGDPRLGVLACLQCQTSLDVLMPMVDELIRERVARTWEIAASFVGRTFEQEFRDRAAALRGAR